MLSATILVAMAAMAAANTQGGDIDFEDLLAKKTKDQEKRLGQNLESELTRVCNREDGQTEDQCLDAVRAFQDDQDEKKALRDTFFAISEARQAQFVGLANAAENAKELRKRDEDDHAEAVDAFNTAFVDFLVAAQIQVDNAADEDAVEDILNGLERADGVEGDVRKAFAEIQEAREELNEAIEEAEKNRNGGDVAEKQAELDKLLKAFQPTRDTIEALLRKKGQRFNLVEDLIDDTTDEIAKLIFDSDEDEAREAVSIRHAVLAAKDADKFDLVNDLALEFGQIAAATIEDNDDKVVTYEYVCAQDRRLNFGDVFGCDLQLAALADRAGVEFDSFNTISQEFIDIALEAKDADKENLGWKEDPAWASSSSIKHKPGHHAASSGGHGYGGDDESDSKDSDDEEDSASGITLALASIAAMFAANL